MTVCIVNLFFAQCATKRVLGYPALYFIKVINSFFLAGLKINLFFLLLDSTFFSLVTGLFWLLFFYSYLSLFQVI